MFLCSELSAEDLITIADPSCFLLYNYILKHCTTVLKCKTLLNIALRLKVVSYITDEEMLTGSLNVTIHKMQGVDRPCGEWGWGSLPVLFEQGFFYK